MLCVVLVAFSAASRAGLLLTDVPRMAAYYLTFSRLDGLAVGAFIAVLVREPGGLARLLRVARPVAILPAAAVLAIAARAGTFDPASLGMRLVGYTLVALTFGAILVLAIGSPQRARLVRLLEQPLLRRIGRYSYAISLFHVPIFAAVQVSLAGTLQLLSIMGSPLPGQLAYYAIGISASLLAGWLSWHGFEKHMLALKRFFPEPRQRVGKQAEPAGRGEEASLVLSPANERPPGAER